METEVELSTFAARVKWLRRLLGKSAEAFADETGIVIGTLRYIEQGRTLNPGMNIIEQICSTYDVSEKWLIRNMGPVFDSAHKLEVELVKTQEELYQTRRILDQAQAEVAGKETIIQALLNVGKIKPAATKHRLGKDRGVSKGSSERAYFLENFPLKATLRATPSVMS